MMKSILLLVVPVIAGAQGPLTVTAFEDRNGNGVREAGERALAEVVISNQDEVVKTDAGGTAHIARGVTGVVFVSTPDGYRSVGRFWRPTSGDSAISFALRPAPAPREFSFVHGSDPHIAPAVVERTRMFRSLVDSIHPAFAILTGDLIRDAMSQQEPLARSYFELFRTELKALATPLWTVPGNHDHFGIIPSRSGANKSNPMYDRGMYRSYLGPDYYSFTFGGVHFIGLNTLMTDDSAYYGRVDSVQLAWMRRDLAQIPAAMPVVTFNHIPMVSAWEMLTGFVDMPLVASIKPDAQGHPTHRHTVVNTLEVMEAMRGHRWVLSPWRTHSRRREARISAGRHDDAVRAGRGHRRWVGRRRLSRDTLRLFGVYGEEWSDRLGPLRFAGQVAVLRTEALGFGLVFAQHL
jgi:hypothetical protein